MDFNELQRVDKMQNSVEKSDAVKILIDHHPEPDNFPDFIFSDTNTSYADKLVSSHIIKDNWLT